MLGSTREDLPSRVAFKVSLGQIGILFARHSIIAPFGDPALLASQIFEKIRIHHRQMFLAPSSVLHTLCPPPVAIYPFIQKQHACVPPYITQSICNRTLVIIQEALLRSVQPNLRNMQPVGSRWSLNKRSVWRFANAFAHRSLRC